MRLATPQKLTKVDANIPLVQFVIGGAQKGGTTALHDMLIDHPELHLPKRKELHYFDQCSDKLDSDSGYSDYHRQFDVPQMGKQCGEATPSYIYIQSAVSEIQKYNPKMKWIILLRQPVLRAYSQWNMQYSRGIEPLSFLEALNAEQSRLNSLSLNKRHRFAYAQRGRYAVQILNLYKHFERSQCLFLKSDSMYNNTTLCLRAICKFLEISDFAPARKTSHKGNYQHSLSETLIRELTAQFKSDILKTEALTGLDLSLWYNSTS